MLVISNWIACRTIRQAGWDQEGNGSLIFRMNCANLTGMTHLFPGFSLRLLIATCIAAACPAAGQIIDRNANGISDVWELAHPGITDWDADDDGDGFTNRQEAAAGTNPFDTDCHPRIRRVEAAAGEGLTLHWPSMSGVRYRVFVSPDLREWTPVGNAGIGDGTLMVHEISLQADAVDPRGRITRSKWTGLTGWTLDPVTQAAATGIPAPALVDELSTVETPQTNPDEANYGQWLRGWVLPPETGDYTFWIASDDLGELWLSADEEPVNKRRIARVPEWTGLRNFTKYPEQQSAPQPLIAGRGYYFEAFHREFSGGDHLSVAWTRPGMAQGTREILAAPHIATAGPSAASVMAGGQRIFIRLEASQTDSDGDGVSDYEEAILGLDRLTRTSTPRIDDHEAALRILDSESTLAIGVARPRAYESTGGAAEFIVFRAGGIGPFEAGYVMSGTATEGDDYAALPGVVRFGPGQRSAVIRVAPIDDGILEAQETATLTLLPGQGYLLGSPNSASVAIDDAPDLLFVAQLRAADGVTGGGSGIAAVRRAGNALGSMVNLSFTGLGGAPIAAEFFVSTTGLGGPVALTLPGAQEPGVFWDFTPAGGLEKDDIVSALDEGRLWVRVTSSLHPGGELIGRLLPAHGWQEMPVPAEPPAAPTAPESTGEAARFLTQATFGPTDESIDGLLETSYGAWIDAQQALPPTHHLPYVQNRRAELIARAGGDGWQGPRNEAWWQAALAAPDQLRQRMAFALSQIAVISQFGMLDIEHEGTALYYDMLVDRAFGNYRDVLEDGTLSPMMGTYLSMIRNRKPDPETGHEPDENYAREVMQLISVGLGQTHMDGTLKLDAEGLPIPTYTQDDTVALAHIFTGWGPHFDEADPPRWSNGSLANRNDWFRWGYDPMRPMSFYTDFHDQQDRSILGGVLVPGAESGPERMRIALDAIFNHPNTAPFVAKQLIQRFVTSNPSPGYMFRVASVFADNGDGTRGDLGATIKAVLLDHEARHPAPRALASFGKPAEPLLRMTRMYRALRLQPPVDGDPRFFINLQYGIPEQAPLLAPSVFNFFQPGYSNPGEIARLGLLSPEFQIFAETTAIRQANHHYSALTWGTWSPEPSNGQTYSVVKLDFSKCVEILGTPGLTPAEAQELLIAYLDDLLLFGAMSAELKNDIRSTFAALPSWYDTSPDRQLWRARVAAWLLLNSPEFFNQR